MTLSTAALRGHLTAQAHWMSPLGDILMARSAQGLAGLWFANQKYHPGLLAAPDDPADALLARTIERLQAYFAGQAVGFTLPLDLHGTPFQRQVWSALLSIAPGHTRSYAEIARDVGSPAAVRAVGAAIGRNPVSLIVPCHRVLGSNGALTGYAGGLERKRVLLTMERAL